MLKIEKSKDVEIMLETPHFYPDGPTPAEFESIRTATYEREKELKKAYYLSLV